MEKNRRKHIVVFLGRTSLSRIFRYIELHKNSHKTAITINSVLLRITRYKINRFLYNSNISDSKWIFVAIILILMTEFLYTMWE